jgi:hypothetical protein
MSLQTPNKRGKGFYASLKKKLLHEPNRELQLSSKEILKH